MHTIYELSQEISESPELVTDIFALVSKRSALEKFKGMMAQETTEPEWQKFFEENDWIFGLGLNFVPLEKIYDKFESTTTGSSVDGPGKRVDALMKTKAEVSQSVLAEIKRSDTPILSKDEYRRGCWSMSNHVVGAVTQIQKTVFEFANGRLRTSIKDKGQNLTGASFMTVQPKSYLIVGNLSEFEGNDDKLACFELFRKNTTSPEIVTFDELYERAKGSIRNSVYEG